MERTFLTSSINTFHSVYLSVASHLNCGCLSTGPPSLCPLWSSDLWLCASDNVWIVTRVASATALAIASFIAIWSSTCCFNELLCFLPDYVLECYYSVFLFETHFNSWHHVMIAVPYMMTNTLTMFQDVYLLIVLLSVCDYNKCMHLNTVWVPSTIKWQLA